MFQIRLSFLTSALLFCASSSLAIPIQYSVNATFVTGGSILGTFTLDGATNTIVDSNIAVNPGLFGGPDVDYYLFGGSGVPYVQTNPGASAAFLLTFRTPFTELRLWLGGSVATFSGGSILTPSPADCGILCSVIQSGTSVGIGSATGRLISSGTVQAVPEPTTGYAIGSLAIMGLCGSYLRRSNHWRRS